MKRPPEGERIVAARKAAAKELDKPATDPLVKQFAPLLVAHDLLQVRIAGGDTKAIDSLIRLDAAMTAIRSLAGADKPAEEPTIHTVEFVMVPPKDGAIPEMPCRRCGWRHGDDIPALPLPQSELQDVTSVVSPTVTPVTDAKVLEPDKIIPPPAKRVRHNEQSEEPLFSMCTIGKGVQTSDRWSR